MHWRPKLQWLSILARSSFACAMVMNPIFVFTNWGFFPLTFFILQTLPILRRINRHRQSPVDRREIVKHPADGSYQKSANDPFVRLLWIKYEVRPKPGLFIPCHNVLWNSICIYRIDPRGLITMINKVSKVINNSRSNLRSSSWWYCS